jgi:hypothetical protein
MRLTLGSRSYDLTTRALVLVAPVAAGDLLVEGAELCAEAQDLAGVEDAVSEGARLVHLPRPTGTVLQRCAAAGLAVVVPGAAVDMAHHAGLPPDRVVSETLWLDVTGDPCPTAATAVGVIRGARLVLTSDVQGARRICDVLAAILEAR